MLEQLASGYLQLHEWDGINSHRTRWGNCLDPSNNLSMQATQWKMFQPKEKRKKISTSLTFFNNNSFLEMTVF